MPGAPALCVALASLAIYAPVPRLRAWLRPPITHTVEAELPAASHVERIEAKPVVVAPEKPPEPPPPEKPAKLPATPQRPALVWIAPGSFTMGSPKTEEGRSDDEKPHRVKLTQGLYVMETEVTQGQYKAVMGNNPSASTAYCRDNGVGTTLPVHCVIWSDAVRYANALSAKEGLESCYGISGERVTWPKGPKCTGYRLPTDAEWEFAARAGKRTVYSGGNTPDEYAWYVKNSENRVHAVRTRRQNAWGLYDMSGNVDEWVWDWYTDEPWKLRDTDPAGPPSGSFRVFRGGSWAHGALYARVADRSAVGPGDRCGNRGFRLSRSYP